MHSQYSKIQFFCSMAQMETATNESHGMKLKISKVSSPYKLSWLITLSTSSLEFVSKWFLVWNYTLVKWFKVMAWSITFFCHELSPIPISSSYHLWKLRFQGEVYTTPSRKNVCKKRASYKGLMNTKLILIFIKT